MRGHVLKSRPIVAPFLSAYFIDSPFGRCRKARAAMATMKGAFTPSLPPNNVVYVRRNGRITQRRVRESRKQEMKQIRLMKYEYVAR